MISYNFNLKYTTKFFYLFYSKYLFKNYFCFIFFHFTSITKIGLFYLNLILIYFCKNALNRKIVNIIENYDFFRYFWIVFRKNLQQTS